MTFQKKTNYMSEMENWLQTEVFPPITKAHADGDAFAIEKAYDATSKLIKEKLLESYRNGQSAKQTSKPKSYAS